jgi:hypothetical protein
VQAVKTTGYDEKKAHEVSRDAGTVLSPGVYDAVIDQAFEKLSRNNRETIELTLNVYDGRGGGRFIKDWLSDAAIAAVKMRHCCAACGNEVLAAYETGQVNQDMFPGKTVRVRLCIDKPRGLRPRNTVIDYMAADASVVNLRAAR